ncbi:MAG: peptidylprolyl isomerase [Phycisphaerales bacterium JB059]
MNRRRIWDASPRGWTVAAVGVGTLLLGACSGTPGAAGAPLGEAPQRDIRVDVAPTPARAPAIINGQAVAWSELHARLGELAGRQALEELALDRALERELQRRGLSVHEDDLRQERDLLNREIGVSDAANVLGEIRRQRRLGPEGFNALIRRNAMLRALTRESVTVEPREVELAERVRHGARKGARILVTPTEREAAALRREILGAPGDRLEAFIARAATRSIDASGARGGDIGAVSPVDPAFPDSLRRALDALAPGQVSNVIAIDGGFAVLMVERDIPAEAVSASQRARIERELRLRKQRLAMDRLADQLLDRSSVSVLDPSLAWSWENAEVGG